MRSEADSAVHRVLERELVEVRRRKAAAAPVVLDVGGGSGVWSVPLAVAGCQVTVVDPSPNALAALHRRALDAGVTDRVTPIQGDTDALGDLVPQAGADVVLGHGVLEVVEDPATALAGLAAAVAPGGVLSVLAANRFAAVLSRAMAGRFEDAIAQLKAVPGGTHRFDSDSLSRLLADAGLTVELVRGHGVLTDLVPGSVIEAGSSAVDTLAELESLAAETPPLRDIAARVHIIARRPR
ncbi:class I SAM-dependent methyltransferase [Pseudonocardiaceae bacterium YIM PH 21723]|nr:class I SAM-dependent methyltransferase [Pseudonocardiaceae bacterium YIM PH 21723]